MKNEASFVSISICQCSFSNGDTSIIPQELLSVLTVGSALGLPPLELDFFSWESCTGDRMQKAQSS